MALPAALTVALACPRSPAQVAEEATSEPFDMASLFNWDLVSLEQNNPRFNASVLSGFHMVRSPGVTPARAWKTGIGIQYTRQERVAEATNTEVFSIQQVLFTPKLNYGLFDVLEAGVGLESTWSEGSELEEGAGGTVETVPEEAWSLSAVDVGLKWGFLKLGRLRLALSVDARISVDEETFGSLPRSLYNVEVDGDFAVTRRFGLISNLQYGTTSKFFEENLVVFDAGTAYSFSNRFRGMVFGTLQGDDQADSVLLFVGMAAQYVFEQHSFTLALDLQLNEPDRSVRTQKQLDIEFSYTFTF
jgi:hypothetical protein